MERKRVFTFVLGMAVGLTIGGVAPVMLADEAENVQPRVVGGDGYLIGWDVVDSYGNIVCSDPWVWVATREIECE